MEKISLSINGVQVSARRGQTILDVARENEIAIPTLCHDDRLKPFGSCLLCRVEVEGARGNMLACATEVTDGMVVRTETDAVNESRKTCLELLVSQHYGDCVAPCSMTCPAGIDVQGYIAHIANGQYQEAVKLIKEKNPLPLVCGRVCTRPCEDECRRNLVDERVGIDYLKRFVADYDLFSGNPYIPERKSATGKKVAVVGAGPAGLSCAYYLACEGHTVTIFERWPAGGGMLRYGIPEYRQPKDILDKEIEIIKALGVEIRYNTAFGKDVTYAGLKKEGYEAFFLGVGSQIGMPMGCDGEACTLGVFSGVEFLGMVGLNTPPDFSGKKVVVVGGGNTAIDAARTSLRLGAAEVKIAYRRTKAEMPAHDMEIEEAEFEGVHIDELIAPLSIAREADGRVKVVFFRMELGEMDASGRRKPVPVPGSEYAEYCDYLIAAIGQTQDLSFVDNDFCLAVDKNRISVDSELLTTSVAGVFAGGDAVTGPQTAIKAIAAGRKAALSINKYLRGEKLAKPQAVYNHVKGKLSELDKDDFAKFDKVVKEKMPMLDKQARSKNFKEVELGFSEEQARREAARCLSCGCKDAHECKLREYATTYNVEQHRLAGEISKHPIDDSHPFISRDQNKCIMCGRCVRICLELQGAGALGFISRGYNTVVASSFGQPFGEESRCEACGQCVSSCPVGALTEKVNLGKPGPFVEKITPSVCTFCGTGCSIDVHTAGNKFIRATAKAGRGVNDGNLCTRGKFGNDFINSPERLTKPLIRKQGTLVEATWDEAFKAVEGKLPKGKTAVYASQRLSNEELYLAKLLAEHGTGKLASFGLRSAAFGVAAATGAAASTATYDDLKQADFIACIGFDIKEANPVAALIVKSAAEQGRELFMVHDGKSKLDRFAAEVIPVPSKSAACFAAQCAAALSGAKAEAAAGKCDDTSSCQSLIEAAGRFAAKLAKAARPVLIIGGDLGANEAEAVARLAATAGKPEHSLLVMHGKANTQGALDMGAVPACGAAAETAVVLGEDPAGCGLDEAAALFKQSGFKIVADLFLTETAKLADVVLPLATFAETAGTFTNSEGRLQRLAPCLSSASGKDSWAVIDGLCAVAGVKTGFTGPDDILAQLRRSVPAYAKAEAGEILAYARSGAAAGSVCEAAAAPKFADTVELWFAANNPRK